LLDYDINVQAINYGRLIMCSACSRNRGVNAAAKIHMIQHHTLKTEHFAEPGFDGAGVNELQAGAGRRGTR
jgi:hypothetical protein